MGTLGKVFGQGARSCRWDPLSLCPVGVRCGTVRGAPSWRSASSLVSAHGSGVAQVRSSWICSRHRLTSWACRPLSVLCLASGSSTAPQGARLPGGCSDPTAFLWGVTGTALASPRAVTDHPLCPANTAHDARRPPRRFHPGLSSGFQNAC